MRTLRLLLSAVLALAVAQAAPAQPTDLKARVGKDWKHKPTGIQLPAQLAGLQRDSVKAFGNSEIDVAGDYWSVDGADTVTVYLYRNVSGSVPVWFDRARTIIHLLPEKYADPRGTGIRAVTPRGQLAASGLMEILTTSGKNRTTGLMMIPVNGFYAKIRATSTARDPASLEQLMLAVSNEIDWTSRQKEVAATPVPDCPSSLPSRPPARLAAASKDDQMMSALIGGIVAQAASLDEAAKRQGYCREFGPAQISYGIYRPDASTERYLMALVDSGRAIVVGSSDLNQILSELKTAPRVSVSHVELDRTATYGDFETLPLPDQAVEMVEKTAPLSVASTWGKKNRNLTINMGQ